VEGRADAHDVDRERAATEAGNLLTILERGPERPLERALVAAFAVRGFAERLAGGTEDEHTTLIKRFVRHADWLEVATPYAVYAFVPELLASELAERVWDAVAAAAIDEDGKGPEAVATRARIAARLGILSDAGEAGRSALGRIAAKAGTAPIRAMASALAARGSGDGGGGAAEAGASGPADAGASGTGSGGPSGTKISGRLGRAPVGGIREVLRLISGVALLAWIVRTAGAAVGHRREAEVELRDDALKIRHRTHLLGRVVREGEDTYTIAAVAGAGRDVRYPSLHLLVGAVALSAGILAGGLVAFDGIRGGDTLLVVVAAAIILAGAGLDLALEVLIPGRTGRVALDLRMLPKRTVRLSRIPHEDADRFLAALTRTIARQ
jgi:hypothetical protein